jgi:hypothetical protein
MAFFQGGGDAVVVLGGDKHIGVEGANLLAPRFGVIMTVLAEARRHRLIEEREVKGRYVDQLEFGIIPLLRNFVDPVGDRFIVPSWARAPGHDGNSDHVLSSCMRWRSAD